MAITTPIDDAGLQLKTTSDGKLQVYGDKSKIGQLCDYIKANKQLIIKALAQSGRPSECESCPAAAIWDYAQYADQGLICFFEAFYRGRPGKKKPCSELRSDCPRMGATKLGRFGCGLDEQQPAGTEA